MKKLEVFVHFLSQLKIEVLSSDTFRLELRITNYELRSFLFMSPVKKGQKHTRHCEEARRSNLLLKEI